MSITLGRCFSLDFLKSLSDCQIAYKEGKCNTTLLLTLTFFCLELTLGRDNCPYALFIFGSPYSLESVNFLCNLCLYNHICANGR